MNPSSFGKKHFDDFLEKYLSYRQAQYQFLHPHLKGFQMGKWTNDVIAWIILLKVLLTIHHKDDKMFLFWNLWFFLCGREPLH